MFEWSTDASKRRKLEVWREVEGWVELRKIEEEVRIYFGELVDFEIHRIVSHKAGGRFMF